MNDQSNHQITKSEIKDMVYKAIGLMSGSSLDGLDIVFVELHENAGNWNFEILTADCYEYDEEWREKLKNAITLNALDYQLLHTDLSLIHISEPTRPY